MKKIIICGLAGAMLAGRVWAVDDCGFLENYINETSNPNMFWVTTTTETLTDPMGYTNAQTTCNGRTGGSYCPSYQVAHSPVVVEACAKFRAAGVADFSTDWDTYWCCTNKDTQAMVTELLTEEDSGGNDDSGGTTNTTSNIILECPSTATNLTTCAQGCGNIMPMVFGVSMDGVGLCADLGVSTDATYCCYDDKARSTMASHTCPGNMISSITRTAGGRTYSSGNVKTATYSGASLKYYQLTANAGLCICSPGYYGDMGNALNVNSSTCTKCPCVNSANGEKCGNTYDSTALEYSNFWQSVVQSGGIGISMCNIQCNVEDGCYDEAGTFIHEDTCNHD